jgi:protein-S-isoprenylcysteine O-methyltransferase Ste14
LPQQYVTLILAWLIFGILHSLLASGMVKTVAMRKMGNAFKYYRFIYSMLAFASLVFVLHAHFSCTKYVLWLLPLIEKILAGIMVLAGLSVMIVSGKKYLPRISGIDVMIHHETKPILFQNDVNAYVRHPLYLGTLLFVWGMFLGYPYLNMLVSCTCITVYTLIGAKLEEKKLTEIFGEEYINYRRNVPMMIPRLL